MVSSDKSEREKASQAVPEPEIGRTPSIFQRREDILDIVVEWLEGSDVMLVGATGEGEKVDGMPRFGFFSGRTDKTLRTELPQSFEGREPRGVAALGRVGATENQRAGEKLF